MNLGQNIRNRFPLWSKIRKDHSSIGAILFDALGEELESLRFSIHKHINEKRILSNRGISEPANLNIFFLSESETFKRYRDTKEFLSSITATGVKGGNNYNLEVLDSYSEFCSALPTRIEIVDSNKDYDYLVLNMDEDVNEGNSTYLFYKDPTKIYVNIYDSTNYEIKEFNENQSERRAIILRGRNAFNQKVEEEIIITNDGLYESKNTFLKLEALERDLNKNISGGPSIEIRGVKAKKEVLKYPVQVESKEYKLKLLSKINDQLNFNNSLIEVFSFLNVSLDSNNKSLLKYIFRPYSSGEEYIHEKSDLTKSDYEEALLTQELLSNSNESISILDFALDDVKHKIVSIDSDGIIHWHELKATAFQKQQYAKTREILIGIESEKQRVSLDEEIDMHFSIERAKGSIYKVLIARQTPTLRSTISDEFNFEYLQDDKTWSSQINFFDGNDSIDVFKNFDSISAPTIFEEYGQHDFYVYCFSDNYSPNVLLTEVESGVITGKVFKDSLLSFIKDKEQKIVFVDRYSVMCESNSAQLSLDSGIVQKLTDLGKDLNEFSFGIWFENVENNIFIAALSDTETLIWEVKEYKDYLLYENTTATGGYLEDYEEVQLTINGELNEVVYG